MKRIIAVVALVSLAAFAADRTIVYPEVNVVVNRVVLELQPDAGCAVTAFASLKQSDGGSLLEVSPRTDVSGANRTTCLDIVTNKAVVLFKSTNGF